MSEEKTPLQRLESLHTKLVDIQKSFVAVVEKVAQAQAESMNTPFRKIEGALGDPFKMASEGAAAMEKLVHETELERNRLQQK